MTPAAPKYEQGEPNRSTRSCETRIESRTDEQQYEVDHHLRCGRESAGGVVQRRIDALEIGQRRVNDLCDCSLYLGEIPSRIGWFLLKIGILLLPSAYAFDEHLHAAPCQCCSALAGEVLHVPHKLLSSILL